MNRSKSLKSRVKSTQDEKVRFMKGKQLKVTQVEFILFFIFKSVYKPEIKNIFFP